jgi:hypothetical protein
MRRVVPSRAKGEKSRHVDVAHTEKGFRFSNSA